MNHFNLKVNALQWTNIVSNSCKNKILIYFSVFAWFYDICVHLCHKKTIIGQFLPLFRHVKKVVGKYIHRIKFYILNDFGLYSWE